MCIISTAQQARPKVMGHIELCGVGGATQRWSQQKAQEEILEKISCYSRYRKSSCLNDITAPNNSTTAGSRNITFQVNLLITLNQLCTQTFPRVFYLPCEPSWPSHPAWRWHTPPCCWLQKQVWRLPLLCSSLWLEPNCNMQWEMLALCIDHVCGSSVHRFTFTLRKTHVVTAFSLFALWWRLFFWAASTEMGLLDEEG